MNTSSPTPCASCRQPVVGTYCSACGERVVRPEDESLGYFLRDAAKVITSADSQLWRSLGALFVPGKLTEEHFAGRRRLYLHPVRVFLILNVVFFFALSSAGGSMFRGPLSSHTNAELYGGLATRVTENQREGWDVTPEVYAAAFDQRADMLAPSLIGLLVPILALLLALVLAPARHSGVRHLVFSTHAVATIMATLLAALVVVTLLVLGIVLLGYEGDLQRGVDPIVIPLSILAVVTYFVIGIRRVYRVSWWAAVPAGAFVGTLGLYGALVLFRFLLFWATVAMLDAPANPALLAPEASEQDVAQVRPMPALSTEPMPDSTSRPSDQDAAETIDTHNPVDEASYESFPASDPPAWTGASADRGASPDDAVTPDDPDANI